MGSSVRCFTDQSIKHKRTQLCYSNCRNILDNILQKNKYYCLDNNCKCKPIEHKSNIDVLRLYIIDSFTGIPGNFQFRYCLL